MTVSQVTNLHTNIVHALWTYETDGGRVGELHTGSLSPVWSLSAPASSAVLAETAHQRSSPSQNATTPPPPARRNDEDHHHRRRQHGPRHATRSIAGGHEVEIVDRDPAGALKLAQELAGSATALDPDSTFGGEVVVFAVYYPGIKDAVQQYADRLTGKVVVDITNPVDTQTWDRLATEPGRSSAEEVAQLASDGGLRPLDVGPLARAQQLEHLGLLHISLQQPLNLNFGSAIKLHP